MSYFTDLRDSAIDGLGFGDGDSAAKTVGQLFSSAVAPSPAPAPAKGGGVSTLINQQAGKKIFGVSAVTLLALGVVAFIVIKSFRGRS